MEKDEKRDNDNDDDDEDEKGIMGLKMNRKISQILFNFEFRYSLSLDETLGFITE